MRQHGEKVHTCDDTLKEALRAEWGEIVLEDGARFARYASEAADAALTPRAPPALCQLPPPREANNTLMRVVDLTCVSPSALVAGRRFVDHVPFLSEFPITQDMLQHALLDNDAIGRGGSNVARTNIVEVETTFSKKHNSFGIHRAMHKPIAQPIPYVLPTPHNETGMRTTIQAGIRDFINGAIGDRKLAEVCWAHVVFKCAPYRPPPFLIPDYFWIWVTSGNSAAGLVPCRLNFVDLAEIDTYPDGSLLLETARRSRIDTRRQLPFGGPCNHGMLMHHSFNDLAARIMHTSTSRDMRIELSVYKHKLVRGMLASV